MKEQNPYHVFLGQKYSFQVQIGNVKFREVKKIGRSAWKKYSFPKDLSDKMKEKYRKLCDDRIKLQNIIQNYQSTSIDVEGTNVKSITYWNNGEGSFLQAFVGMGLECVDEFQYAELDYEYKEICKFFSEGNYSEEDKINELIGKYENAISYSENAIKNNLEKIREFVSKYGIPYIDSIRRIERKQGEQIDDDLRSLFQEEGNDVSKMKIFSDIDLYEQSIPVSVFTIIYESFCLLLDMHSSLVKQDKCFLDETFKKQVNLFLKYLTWPYFFIGNMENKNLCRSFACLNDMYISAKKLINDQGTDIDVFLENAITTANVISQKYVGDGRKSDIEIVDFFDGRSDYIRLPIGDLNYNYAELKAKFCNLEKVLSFIHNNIILRFNERGYYEVENYKDNVLTDLIVKGKIIKKNWVIKKTVRDEIGSSLSEVMLLILQDLINDTFVQSQDIFRLNIKERKIGFAVEPRPIDALKIEFAFDVIKGITFERCKNCKKLFIPTSRNRVGCCRHKCTDAYLKRIKRNS